MTSPSDAAPNTRRPTREQGIAALLVGAVVILLGFASGLGLAPQTTPTAAQPELPAPASSALAAPGSTPAPTPTTSTVAPVAYVAEPAPAPPPVTVVAVAPAGPNPTTPAPSSAGPTTGVTAPSSPPAEPTSTAAPAPGCSPSLLTALLDALLPPSGDSSAGLLGLGGLLRPLTDLTGAAGTLLQGGTGGLLQQVTSLLDGPSLLPAHPDPTTLGGPCTADVEEALRAVAAGENVSTAVTAVTR